MGRVSSEPPMQGRRHKDVWDSFLGICGFLAVIPYKDIYRHNTLDPIVSIIEKGNDDAASSDTLAELERWSKLKLREAQYVQVAGAVLFASTTAALSWPSMTSIHWSGPALWYTAVVFSLMAIILGAQQTMVIPDISPSSNDVAKILRKLAGGRDIKMGRHWPGRRVLFALQAPLMCLTYSILLFLAGLTSVVLSPLARNPGWNAEAKVGGLHAAPSLWTGYADEPKTTLVFLIASAIVAITFVSTSWTVHSLAKD